MPLFVNRGKAGQIFSYSQLVKMAITPPFYILISVRTGIDTTKL